MNINAGSLEWEVVIDWVHAEWETDEGVTEIEFLGMIELCDRFIDEIEDQP